VHLTYTSSNTPHADPAANKSPELIKQAFRHLAKTIGSDLSSIQPTPDVSKAVEEWNAQDVLEFLFDLEDPVAWVQLNDAITSPILEAALICDESSSWIRERYSHLVELFSKPVRQCDLAVLFSSKVAVTIKSLVTLFSNLREGKGHEFNNKIAKLICVNATLVMDGDPNKLRELASKTLGKNSRKDLNDVLKKASAQMTKSRNQRSQPKPAMTSELPDFEAESQEMKSTPAAATAGDEKKADKAKQPNQSLREFTNATEKIRSALQWYSGLLEELVLDATSKKVSGPDHTDNQVEQNHSALKTDVACESKSSKTPIHSLTPEQVSLALANKDLSEDTLAQVENGIDLIDWDTSECW
jgi:hypothetical protein